MISEIFVTNVCYSDLSDQNIFYNKNISITKQMNDKSFYYNTIQWSIDTEHDINTQYSFHNKSFENFHI